jgi:DNA-binding CsgD family transcriptional regulator/tetratricopeptide (TPR) repeat protein
MNDPLERGQRSFREKAWGDAYAGLSAADRQDALAPGALEQLAAAAYLTGRDQESATVFSRAHQQFLQCGDVEAAARCAFWTAFVFLDQRELAQSAGWLARAQRLLDERGCDSVLRGYLLVPSAMRFGMDGNMTAAYAVFSDMAQIAERFHDSDLLAMARHGQGRASIGMGKTSDGLALLDEVMVAVTSGEVSPIVAGKIYCSVIEACHEIYDLRRAQEWTSALSRWCASQPDLVPYRGLCLVRRAELLQLHGEWDDAIEEARRAGERVSDHSQAVTGWALYQEAELHRLQGDFGVAERMYRQASERGKKPQPGLSLLRFAQGQIETAAASIRNALAEASDPRSRSRILSAYVDIMLAANDVSAARTAALELRDKAAGMDAPLPSAVAAYAMGAVLLAEGDARQALATLRSAWTLWGDLDAPYEMARARLLIALACRALGDTDSANMEFDAARQAFAALGAVSDIVRLDVLWKPLAPDAPGGLSVREVQVLRLIATGKTNRTIAEELFISEKTVARHVSNIFTKLDLSSRAAATAYAYERHLV